MPSADYTDAYTSIKTPIPDRGMWLFYLIGKGLGGSLLPRRGT
ncbi:hypothetical protein [Nostoc sp.]